MVSDEVAVDWPAELAARRAAFGRIVDESEADAALVFGSQGRSEHFRYLTNFAPVLGDMWLVRDGDGSLACFLDFHWQLDEARERSGIGAWQGGYDAVEAVGAALGAAPPRRLAVAGLDRLPVAAWERLRASLGGAEVVDVGERVGRLRRRKSSLEVGLLREAARLTDHAFDVAREEARPGISERELAARLGYALGPEWAFTPCVVGGLDGTIPIREPTARPLEAGDTVMIDIGAACEGYQADATRTFVLGRPSAEQRRVWDVVQRAYDAVLAVVRAGVPCAELQRAGQRVIENAGYRLAHRIGHGIGLATSFEWPPLDIEEAPLEPGTTICVEPGICAPGVGVMKLEDDLVITEDGYELLTQADRSLATAAA